MRESAMVDVLVGVVAFAVVMTLYGLLARGGHHLDEDVADLEPQAEAPLPEADAAA
jgi:hypothetical protein